MDYNSITITVIRKWIYMKISALKYNLFVIILSIVFAILDGFVIFCCGFGGELLIFVYVIIGLVPLCGIISICIGMSPTIVINHNFKTITSNGIANEFYKSDKHYRNQCDEFYYDEIVNCEINGKKLEIKLKYGQTKTLNLSFFTKNQRLKIKNEIFKIINKT